MIINQIVQKKSKWTSDQGLLIALYCYIISTAICEFISLDEKLSFRNHKHTYSKFKRRPIVKFAHHYIIQAAIPVMAGLEHSMYCLINFVYQQVQPDLCLHCVLED